VERDANNVQIVTVAKEVIPVSCMSPLTAQAVGSDATDEVRTERKPKEKARGKRNSDDKGREKRNPELPLALGQQSGEGPAGPWGDPDGDGLLNWQEQMAGTNPDEADGEGAPGLVRWELWRDVPGQYVFDLTRSSEFPQSPPELRYLNRLEIPVGSGNNYGSRVRGLIKAPESGEYTFHVIANDTAELWLGETESWQSKRLVAKAPQQGPQLKWTKRSGGEEHPLLAEQTAKVVLKKGKSYYVELLHKQAIAEDHCAVAWIPPGETEPEVIGAEFLVSWAGERADLKDDGLPDAWQESAGLMAEGVDPAARHAWADPDQDGFTNWAEWKVGSNPLEVEAVLSDHLLSSETWDGAPGERIEDLVLDPRFPASPDFTTLVDNLDFSGEGQSYGSRLRGYLTAAEDGPHVFFVSGNSTCMLFLAESEDKFTKRLMAQTTRGSSWRSFAGNTSQKSAPVELVKGQKYYIEILFKRGAAEEGSEPGLDHASVAWKRPNHLPGVIGAEFFSPYRTDTRDRDGDDLPDDWERANRLDPEDPAGANGAWGDPDGDWLGNFREFQAGLDPLVADVHGAPGFALWEYWENIHGKIPDLRASPFFPLNPTRRDWKTSLEGPTGLAHKYGSRMRAFLVPAATGNYTFAVSGDNDCELWLSDSEEKFDRKLIASVEHWTAYHEWDKELGQVSQPMYLEAGQRYFIEVLHTQGTGGDHLSVGWVVPGSAGFEVIPGTALAGFAGDPNDVDDDDLPDDFELASGSPVGTPNGDQDPDGDGLTNREEYQLGTRLDLADSDGDGINDRTEARVLGSNPLIVDVAPFVRVQIMAGREAAASHGGWREQGSGLVNRGVRGWADYALETPSDGVYLIELQVTPLNRSPTPLGCEIIFEVDGTPIARKPLDLDAPGASHLQVLSPWLRSGGHTLRVFLDNAATQRRICLDQVEILSSAGPDGDGNEVPDWVQQVVAARNTLHHGVTTSKVSPVCLEGHTEWTSYASGADFVAAPNGGWFANVALRADGQATAISLLFENGGQQEDTSVTWVPTNLLQENIHTLRQGDSLLLTATVAQDGVGLPGEEVRIGLEGQTLEFPASDPQPYQFNTPGEIVLVVTHRSEGAVRIERAVVQVVAAPQGTSPVFVPGQVRDWELTGMGGDVQIEWDSRVVQYGLAQPDEAADITRYRFQASAPFDLQILFRLGEGGPVLGAIPMRRLTLRSGSETGVNIAEESEGVYLVRMPVVLSAVFADVTVRYSIFVGGVTYGDGSGPDLDLTSTDFSDLGEGVVEFLKLATVNNSVCHRASIWQGQERIAYFD